MSKEIIFFLRIYLIFLLIKPERDTKVSLFFVPTPLKTMKFPALDKALGDDFRESLSYVYVDKKVTFASDAHIMVIHKTEELFDVFFIEKLGDKTITMHADIIKAIRSTKCHSIELDIENMKIIIKPKPIDIKKPDIHFKIIGMHCNPPQYQRILEEAKKGKEVKEISLNSFLLNNLREALGIPTRVGLCIKFNGESKGMYCRTNGDSDYPSAEGMIMPVQIQREEK